MSDQHIALLIRLYSEQPIVVDGLAYTPEIKAITSKYISKTHDVLVDEAWIYRTLINLRKRRLLPKKGRTPKIKPV